MIPSHKKGFIHTLVRVWLCCLSFQSSHLSPLWGVNGQTTTQCYTSINDLESAESLVTDFSVPRLYTLCPETTFTIGQQDYFGTILSATGGDMIHLRPNVQIQCGDDGARANNCIVSGGTVQVDGTLFYRSNANGTTTTTTTGLGNVILTGLTFTSVEKYHVWIDQPGQVLFRDCAFQDSTDAMLPIFLDYFDPASSTSELNVTIQQCEFLNNRYYGPPAQAALIVGNSKQNRLLLTDTNFTLNDMEFNNTNLERASFLIESSGPIEMTRNCFLHNALGVAPVGVYGSSITATDNFQYNSTGGVCQLSAYFTASSYASFTPICASFDSPRCQAVAVGLDVPTTPTSTLPPSTATPNLTSTVAPTAVPSVPRNASEPALPTLMPTPPLNVGNVTNGTVSPPATAPSGMVFWSPEPTLQNTTSVPATEPALEGQLNSTSSSRSIQQLAWSSVVVAVLMLGVFSM